MNLCKHHLKTGDEAMIRGKGMRWRTGRTLGRTLYVNDLCIGMVDTHQWATRIVEAMNKQEASEPSGKQNHE